MRALIVEHDLMSQCVLAKVLGDQGYEIASFENAEQAVIAYQKEFYPLLFVAVELPGMDGLEFCRWLRSQPNGQDSFVMLATGVNAPSDMNQIIAVGANDFLSKPYEYSRLRARLAIADKQMKQFFERVKLRENLLAEAAKSSQLETTLVEVEGVLQEKSKEYEQQLTQAKASFDTEIQHRQKAETELQQARRELKELRSQLQSYVEIGKAAKDRSHDVESQLASALEQREKELLALRKQLDDGVAAREPSVDMQKLVQQQEQLAAMVRDLINKQSGQTTSTNDLYQKLCELSETVGAQQSQEMVETERKRQQEERELNSLREQLREAHRDFFAEIRRLNTELESSQERAQAAEAGWEQLKKAAATQSSPELQAELERLQTALEDAEREAAMMRQEQRDQEQTISKLGEELATYRQARKQSDGRWRVLLKAVHEFNRARSPKELAQHLAEAAEDLVGWDTFSFDLYDVGQDQVSPILTLRNQEGSASEIPTTQTVPEPTSMMRQVQEKGPQLILKTPPSSSKTDFIHRTKTDQVPASLMYLPVQAGGRLIGFLSLESRHLNAYDGDDVEAILGLTLPAGGAAERMLNSTGGGGRQETRSIPIELH